MGDSSMTPVSSTQIPEWMSSGLKQNYGLAQQLSQRPFQKYQTQMLDANGKPIAQIDPATGKGAVDATGNPIYQMQDLQRTAGFSGDQQNAFNMVRQQMGLPPMDYSNTTGQGPQGGGAQPQGMSSGEPFEPQGAMMGMGRSGGPAPQTPDTSMGGTQDMGAGMTGGPPQPNWGGHDAHYVGPPGFDGGGGFQPPGSAFGQPPQPYQNMGMAQQATAGALNWHPQMQEAAQANPASMQAAQLGNAATVDPSSIERVQAGSMPGSDISQYMNPYLQQSLDPTLREIQRQGQMMQNQNMAQATGAGAFGGAREGLMEAETQRNTLQQLARTQAEGMNTGFNQATQLNQQDLNRQLSANQGNQNFANQARFGNQAAQNSFEQMQAQMNQQAGLTNSGYAQQAGLANQAATNQMGQFNAGQNLAGAQFRLGAASQAGQQAQQQQGMNYQNIAAMQDIGKQQQSQQQGQLDLAFQNWQNEVNMPYQNLNMLNSALRGTPYNSTTYAQPPNTAAQVGGGIAAIAPYLAMLL